jgi:simple sugar transport system substrate-binding protein
VSACSVALALGIALSVAPGEATAQEKKGPIVLIAGDLSDPFFGVIKRGADDAARHLGVEYTYLSSNISAADLSETLQAAVASNPAGLAFGDWFPDTQNPLVLSLGKAGTPVVGFNSGPENWQESTGALAWVRQDDRAAGALAGKLLAEAGVKQALCVNHGPGATLFEDRCDGLQEGMAAAGGTSSDLSIPYTDATNPEKVMQAIRRALNANPEIDGLFTLGSGTARDAVRAIRELPADRKFTIGTVDLSGAVLESIQKGHLLFAIDQQPYLQGYYAITILAQKIKYGLHPLGEVTTGPLAITKDNATRVLEINRTEAGIRGAP